MIDISSEHLIALADVPAILPKRRGGKRVHLSCIYRWTTAGCRHIVLESIQIGGTRCTSKEALGRFFERLGNPHAERGETQSTQSRGRERQKAAAERECDRAGL